MPDFGVIADVSNTLQDVLTKALSTLLPLPSPIAQIHDLQGNISIAPARLTLFLYEAVEDPSARNRPRVQKTTTTDITEQKPPMALLLRYMMTPWSGDRFTDHRILGRAMQVLYDGAIISGSKLKGGLAGTDQALKITLQLLTLEERTRVWQSVQKPYRLSVVYEVRVINLDPITTKHTQPVKERSLDFAVPEATI